MEFQFLCLVQLLTAIVITAHTAVVKRQEPDPVDIIYEQFHVDSLIVSRYAVTTITSVVRNDNTEESKELNFRVQLPESAFISNFSMLVLCISVLYLYYVELRRIIPYDLYLYVW